MTDPTPSSGNPGMRAKVEQALAVCRPYLQADGGDVELLGVSEDGVVEVRFTGTCTICPLSKLTLRAGLERVILQSSPDIRRVEERK